MQENLSLGFVNSQGADQIDQHLCYSLAGAHISQACSMQISIFYLVSVAKQAGLGMTWSETPKSCELAPFL